MQAGALFAPLAIAKFGQRALAQSMARELGPKGVHVAHVVVDGVINTERVSDIFIPSVVITALVASRSRA
jgi:NAD(P)-dependent dehydrogenase (short-subunit alcohol dehydrogenase family)